MTELIFDKYEIIRRIASGGMGDIFLAKQTGTPGFERVVILKSLLPELAADQGFVDQFLDEARVAATLNHPNVVGIYEVGLWGGTYFIAMEYIRGVDLTQLMIEEVKREARIPEQITARIISDAALGLDHAHTAKNSKGEEMGIVHRDISPHNIMVRDDGVTKVVDFGIAKAANRSTKTETGVVKGKLAYMSPEQVNGDTLDQRTDQFALGIVFWEMATGQRLFNATNAVKTIAKITRDPIPAPSTLVPGFPPALEAPIMRMLEREPAARFERCADAAQAIKKFLDSASSDVGTLEVAKFVKRLVGEKIDAITRDLTPSSENYFLNLHTGQRQSGRRGLRTWHYAVIVVASMGLGLGLTAWVAKKRAPAPAPVAAAPAAAAPAPVGPPELTLSTTPPGASVALGDQKLGKTPLTTRALAADKPLRLVIEKKGFQTLELDLTLRPGERMTQHLALAKGQGRKRTAARGGSAAGASGQPVAAAEPAGAAPAASAAAASAPAERERPSAAAAAEPGFLTINTNPWTAVTVDGRRLGVTPLAKVQLAPGSYTLRLLNEKAGIDQTRSISIEAGKTFKLNETLAAAAGP